MDEAAVLIWAAACAADLLEICDTDDCLLGLQFYQQSLAIDAIDGEPTELDPAAVTTNAFNYENSLPADTCPDNTTWNLTLCACTANLPNTFCGSVTCAGPEVLDPIGGCLCISNASNDAITNHGLNSSTCL